MKKKARNKERTKRVEQELNYEIGTHRSCVCCLWFDFKLKFAQIVHWALSFNAIRHHVHFNRIECVCQLDSDWIRCCCCLLRSKCIIQIYDKNRIEKCLRLHFSILVTLKCSIFRIIVLDVACSLVAPLCCCSVIVFSVVTRVRMQYKKVIERENNNHKSTRR